jgi:hypothetical protein
MSDPKLSKNLPSAGILERMGDFCAWLTTRFRKLHNPPKREGNDMLIRQHHVVGAAIDTAVYGLKNLSR